MDAMEKPIKKKPMETPFQMDDWRFSHDFKETSIAIPCQLTQTPGTPLLVWRPGELAVKSHMLHV